MSIKDSIEVLKLSDVYCEEKIKRQCVEAMKRLINVENAVSFYRSSIDYHASDLREFCFEFVAEHFQEVVATEDFQSLDEVVHRDFYSKLLQQDGITVNLNYKRRQNK